MKEGRRDVMGDENCVEKLLENLNGRDHLGDLDIDGS
jgi:hypothetical protein